MSTKADSPELKPETPSASPRDTTSRPEEIAHPASITMGEEKPKKRSTHEVQVYVPQDLKREAKQAQILLAVLQRAYQAFSFYPFNHPIVQQFSNQLYNELNNVFQDAPYLELRLDRFRILFYDEVVFEESNVNNNFVYLLYSDGIRKLMFYKGLTLDECFDFFAILHRCSGRRSLHDDVVTLMWEASFAHIRYFLIEDLSATFLPSFAALSGEYNAVEEDAVAPSVRVSASGGQGSGGELALRTVKQLARTRFELKDTETNSLEAMLKEEEQELMHRFLEVLTLLLDNHREAPPFAPLIRVLSQIQPIVVSIGSIEDMLLCFRYIKHLATSLATRNSELAKQWSTTLYEALPEAFSDNAIERLRTELMQQPTDIETQNLVTQYIEFVELQSPAPLLEAMAEISHPEALAVWQEALFNKYQEAPRKLSPGITSSHDSVIVATCYIIGRIGREEAWNLLDRAAQSTSTTVRVAALQAMLQLETSETNTIKLIELVEQFLAAPEPAARIAAIEGLPALGPNAAFLLKTLFEYRTYEQWSHEEIALLFEKVTQLGNYYGDIFDLLSHLLLGHYNGRFTSRKKLEIARIAMTSLQLARTPQSAQTIEWIYQRAAKPLRHVCESIFQS